MLVLWDQIDDRRYETGVDRGVFYPSEPGKPGVPWNGLTHVEENMSEEKTTPIYFDGIKRMDDQSLGNFSGSIKAYTYPPELEDYDGSLSFGDGLRVDSQPFKSFGLSYRTRIGDAIEGVSFGYKIHLVYNVIAIPTSVSRETWGSTESADEFTWNLVTQPIDIPGYRPTAHIVFDSTLLPSENLVLFENILYGSSLNEPRMPSWPEILTIFGELSDVITEPIAEFF